MQCSNCNFFNMPGSDACGRCGTSLRLNSAAIAVMPPRASPLQKRLRRMFPVGRTVARLSEATVATGFVNRAPDRSTLLFYLWCVIPGWPHFARGQQARGHVFLWGFLVTLFAGLALLGSTWGSIFIGLAFSVHSSAIADLVNQRYPGAPVREQMMRGLAVSAVLFMALYWPVGRLIGIVAAPYQLQIQLSPFESGDVILASTLRPPRVGDVVLYDIPDASGQLVRREGSRQWIIEGRNIDRILAGPGAVIESRDGHLFVDGMWSTALPLNLLKFPSGWKDTVPPGCFLIVPSDEGGMLNQPAIFRSIAFVPHEAIVGRVWARTQPWRRFSVIR